MQLNLKILFLPFLFLFLNFAAHPLKMTFSRLEISEKGMLVLTSRLFEDDLSAHLKSLYRLQIIDYSDTESNGQKSLMRYINSRVNATQNGKNFAFQIEKLSRQEDGTVLEVTLKSTEKIDLAAAFTFENQLLTEVFQNQTNNLTFAGKKYRYTRMEKSYELRKKVN